MDDLQHDISVYLQQQFEAFQLAQNVTVITSPSEVTAAASSKAANIQKHVQILALNHGIGQLTLMGNHQSNDNNKDVSSLVEPLLLRYVDAAITTEVTTDNKDAVVRTLELVSAVACMVSDTCRRVTAVETVLARAQEFSEVLQERLRGQACLLLASLAVHMSGLFRRSNKLFELADGRLDFLTQVLACVEGLETTLLPRLTDKSQSVRQAAIKAVGQLLMLASSIVAAKESDTKKKESQKEPMEDELDNEESGEGGRDSSVPQRVSPALKALLWSMWHDPSVANRVEAIQVVPILVDTVDHIVARIRDVKEKVRVAALDVLRLKVNPLTDMTEEHFCDVIQHGLTERCEATKMATMKLICTKWIRVAKFDPVEVLRLMGATVNDEECEKALKVILYTVRSGDYSPIQGLSDPEIRSFCASVDKSMVLLKNSSIVFDEYQLFYTRVACSTANDSTYLSFAQKEVILSKAAPDIPTLCDLFQKHLARYIESIQEEDQESEEQESFVCLQLLQLAKVAGLQEEGSRRHFANVMGKALSMIDTPEELIEECVESLRAAHADDENDFYDAISAVLAALMSSTKLDGDLVLDDEIVSEANMRLLIIFSVVLENASSTLYSHDLRDNMVKIILTAVFSSIKSIREVGVSCFGKLGLLSHENTVLSEFKPILLKMASNQGEALQCRGQAFLALVDWALMYSDILQPHDFEDGQSITVVDCAHALMQHSNQSVVAIASEAAAKLLFSGKVEDKMLLGRLLVVFLDPNRQRSTFDDDIVEADDKVIGSPLRLQQLLSLFFSTFCLKSTENRSILLGSINDALLIASGLSKSKKRPLVFPLIKIVEYVCTIVSHSDVTLAKQKTETAKNERNVGLSSSLQVAEFLLKQEGRVSVPQRRILCKFLGGQEIDLSTSDKHSLLMLKACLDNLALVVDASSARSLLPLTELIQRAKGELEEDVEPVGENGDSSVNSNDDDTFTEHSEDQEIDENDDSSVEDVLMDGLASISVNAKENPPKVTKTTISRKSRRFSTQSNVSILESLGSPSNT
jgi:condensin complex subunit 3